MRLNRGSRSSSAVAEEREFRPDLPQRALGGLVRRLLVRRLQLPAECGAMPLGQIRHDVLALVPLTALQDGGAVEDFSNGGVQALGAVGDDQEAELHAEPALEQGAQKRRT